MPYGMKTNADYQRAHRQRVAARLAQIAKRTDALKMIIERLAGNEKPLAVEIRAMAEDALK